MTEISERMLADVQKLAPAITARMTEIETGRRVPLDLLETLKSIGIFRMFVPQSHGGLEFDIFTGLEIIRALSRIDGSVGWTAMIGSGCALVAALLPLDTYEKIYQNSPDTILAGSSQPGGTAEAVPGGWRVKGRWAFASGCQHADWIFGLCVMTEKGEPLPGPDGKDGPPLIRGCLLPAHEWRIEDTWHVAGLKGTGSHHVLLPGTVVPAANFFDLMTGIPCLSGPLYQAVSQLIPLFHCAFAVGVAEGALDELVTLAHTGQQQLWTAMPMRASEAFQTELGRIASELEAARAFYHARVTRHWRHALAGTLRDEALHTQSTQAAIWITVACVRVVDACFVLGGGIAVYESSPLQRRVRDLHAAAQHAMVHPRHYVGVGKLLLDNVPLGLESVGD